MSYTITLSDGSKLENLRVNGNNFIADYLVTEDTFKYKLSSIDIESDNKSPDDMMLGIELGHHENMEVLAIQHGLHYMQPGEYWFVLAPIPESELKYAKLVSDIDYLAMMTDTEL